MKSKVTVASLLLSAALAASAHAQQAPPPAQPTTSALTDQELAKSAHNPFEDFVKVPIQSTTGFQVGHNHNAGDSFNIQPLVPFSLNADWDLCVANCRFCENRQFATHRMFQEP